MQFDWRHFFDSGTGDTMTRKVTPIGFGEAGQAFAGDGACRDAAIASDKLATAIHEGRDPIASVAQVMPCYRTLHQLEQQLSAAGG